MPSPRELDYSICDVCSTEIRDEDDLHSCERVNWNKPGRFHHLCTHDTICPDCTFNCVDCNRDVCKTCTVEKLSTDGESIYRCIPCQITHLRASYASRAARVAA